MQSKSFIAAAGASALLVCTQIASAHPGHAETSGFAAGASHPFSGIDHILAMIAVGLCAVQLGRRALWLLPAAFLTFMVAGGALGVHGGAVPMVEQGIAVSVLLLGLLVAAGSRVALPVIVGLVSLFGLFHGYAHGVEMSKTFEPTRYALGFLVATALLHSVGIGSGLLLNRNRWIILVRFTGGTIAVFGILLVCMA